MIPEARRGKRRILMWRRDGMGRKRSVHPTKPSVYYNIIKHGPTFHMTGERERERGGGSSNFHVGGPTTATDVLGQERKPQENLQTYRLRYGPWYDGSHVLKDGGPPPTDGSIWADKEMATGYAVTSPSSSFFLIFLSVFLKKLFLLKYRTFFFFFESITLFV